MPSHAINAYEKQARVFSEWVWYETNAALSEGEAVCYNYDFGTDTDADGRRMNRVETPSTSNNMWFAGVAARPYAAVSGGQLIEIYNPGSVCNVLVGVSTVVGTGFLTFDVTTATVGQFRRMGLPGRGSARLLQTTTYVATPQVCLAYLMDGEESGGSEDVTAASGAVVFMVGGSTFIIGAALGSGNCTFTVADGTIEGLRKRFVNVDTDITTADVVITVTTGILLESGALGTITYNNAQTTLNMGIILGWTLSGWNVTGQSKGEPDVS